MIRRGSMDRGFGRCLVIRKHQTMIKRYTDGRHDRTVGPPDPHEFRDGENDNRYKRFKALDKDGICMPGEEIRSGAILVNKEQPLALAEGVEGNVTNPQHHYHPAPLGYRNSTPSMVDKVLITSNENDHFIIKVLLVAYSFKASRYLLGNVADPRLEISSAVGMDKKECAV